MEYFQDLRREIIAKAHSPISYSQPPFVCAALQPCHIALSGVGKPGQRVEDA
jgi:hypothetical protein